MIALYEAWGRAVKAEERRRKLPRTEAAEEKQKTQEVISFTSSKTRPRLTTGLATTGNYYALHIDQAGVL